MNMNTPDQQTVHGALRLANRAPSVHNTQPWQWLLGENSIHLMADWSRHTPATDPDGRDLLLSCGATLHHLRAALAAFGWHAVVHHLPHANDANHLASVELRPRHVSEEDIALASAISHRRTDRRGFSSWPVPGGHLDLMVRRAAEAGALLVPVTDPENRYLLTKAIAAAAWWQANDPEYKLELAKWSGRGRAADDGVLAASAPAGPRTRGDTPMRAFSDGSLAETDTGPGEDDGQLLVLATPSDDPLSRLCAGEAASAALLAATSLNLATCPLSQPLEVADTRARIQEEVLDGSANPQLVLRVGWVPTSAEPIPQSPRRSLHDTVTYLPGTGPRIHKR